MNAASRSSLQPLLLGKIKGFLYMSISQGVPSQKDKSDLCSSTILTWQFSQYILGTEMFWGFYNLFWGLFSFFACLLFSIFAVLETSEC